jgi:hypothetical protein
MRPGGDICVDLRTEPTYGAGMLNPGKDRPGKLKSCAYLCCAMILFALGLWLLLEPIRAHGQSLRDNVIARKGAGT